MKEFYIKILRIFVIIFHVIDSLNGNQCFKPDTLPGIRQGFKINTQPFSTNTSLGPMDCLRICQLYSLCNHVNFNRKTLDCSLLVDNSEFITDTDYISMDVDTRSENFLGVCKNHQCANNTVCKAGNTDYYCEPIGCNGLPSVDNINITSFTSQVLWYFGDMLEYVCKRSYYTTTNVTCLSTGEWSNFDCPPISRCAKTSKCSNPPPGEFWLHSSTGFYKIFCFPTIGPLLTLLHYNMASIPDYTRNTDSCELIPAPDPLALGMGYTMYDKIKISLGLGKVLNQQIYLNSTYKLQRFGRAGDCYAGNDSSVCGVIGRFIINTRGTGLKVKSTVQWKTWGNNGVIMNITRSQDGHVIEGYCGGDCGGCEPDGDIFFEEDPNDKPSMESSEMPICRFPL